MLMLAKVSFLGQVMDRGWGFTLRPTPKPIGI